MSSSGFVTVDARGLVGPYERSASCAAATFAAAQPLTPEALSLAETIGDSFVLSFAQGNLGLVMLLTGDSAVPRRRPSGSCSLRTSTSTNAALRGDQRLGRRRCSARGGRAGRTTLSAAEASGPERHSAALDRQLEERYFGPARARLARRAWRACAPSGLGGRPSRPWTSRRKITRSNRRSARSEEAAPARPAAGTCALRARRNVGTRPC
jgi:hypothetical protein